MGWIGNVEALAGVRARRANPPGRAASGRRSKTFGAALEQFEQLLVAGQRLPPASAPILLFYAVAQAGRAILAAHAGQPWEVHGHGIRVTTMRDPLGATEIAPASDGLFQAVASATGSPPLRRMMTLSEVWGAIPGLPRVANLGLGQPRIFMVTREPRGSTRRVIRDEHGTLLRDAEEFMAGRDRYPELASGNVSVGQQGESVVVAVEFAVDADAQAFDGALWQYLDGAYLLATVRNDPQPSGLMMWWILLQALSQLARYEPAGWVAGSSPG